MANSINRSYPMNNYQSAASSSTSSSKRQLITSKALDLSSKLLTRSANYLSSKDLDQIAQPISRVCERVKTVSSSNQPSPPSSDTYVSRHSKTSSRSEVWKSWDNDTCNWNMKVGGNPAPVSKQQQLSSSSASLNGGSSIQISQASGYLSYLNPQTWQRGNKESYPEDHLICFPGFVSLKSPSHSRAGDIEISVSFYAFKAKANLENLNRSQRLFYHMVCKLTGLPSIPSAQTSSNQLDSNQDEFIPTERDLMALNDDQDLSSCARPELSASTVQGSYEPSQAFNKKISSPSLQQDLLTGRNSPPPPGNLDKILIPNQSVSMIVETQPTPTFPYSFVQNQPTQSKPASSASSSSPRSSLGDTLADQNLKQANTNQVISEKLKIESRSDLHKLHSKLKDRIHSFFCQKLEAQKVRIQIYGLCGKPSSVSTNNQTSPFGLKNHNRESSLISLEEPEKYDIINNGRPLLTQIITTKAGGLWSDTLFLPWQTIETHLRVYHQQQQKFQGNENLNQLDSETGLLKLKIEAEILKDNNDDRPSQLQKQKQNSLFTQDQNQNQGFQVGDGQMVTDQNSLKSFPRSLSVARSFTTMELDVIPAMASAVHVISDIDDTIKKTNVLGGIKSILRNVFLTDFDEVIVPGMSEWYRSLKDQGCLFHYISNSPLELWYCIQGFLSYAKFPSGSVSLKEYARGATSILSGMLESAGSRKLSRIERIVNQFPESKFICVGDSGEQDLEMYVSLAQMYPGRIIGIFIRDVTTTASSTFNQNPSNNRNLPSSPAPLFNNTSSSNNNRTSRSFLPPSRPPSPLRSLSSNVSESFQQQQTYQVQQPQSPSSNNKVTKKISLVSLIEGESKLNQIGEHQDSELESKPTIKAPPKSRPIAPPKPSHLSSSKLSSASSSPKPPTSTTISSSDFLSSQANNPLNFNRQLVESPMSQIVEKSKADEEEEEGYFRLTSYSKDLKKKSSVDLLLKANQAAGIDAGAEEGNSRLRTYSQTLKTISSESTTTAEKPTTSKLATTVIKNEKIYRSHTRTISTANSNNSNLSDNSYNHSKSNSVNGYNEVDNNFRLRVKKAEYEIEMIAPRLFERIVNEQNLSLTPTPTGTPMTTTTNMNGGGGGENNTVYNNSTGINGGGLNVGFNREEENFKKEMIEKLMVVPVFKVFRNGDECVEESLELVKKYIKRF